MKYFQVDDYQLEVASNFEDVKEEWMAFNKCSGLKNSCLEPIANSGINDITPYYVIVKKQDQIIGLIYYQLLRFNADFLDLGLLNKWYFNFLQFFINRLRTNLLINGNLFRTGLPSFYGITEEELAYLTLQIADKKLFTKVVCGMMIKDLKTPLAPKYVEDLGFKKMVSDVVMELEIRESWLTIDDYKSDLKRKYKKRFQKIRKSSDGLEIKSLSLTEIEENKARLDELYRNIVRQQVVRLGILNVDYFIKMKESLEDHFQVFGLFEKQTGKLLAFSSHIYYEQSMEIHYIGLDYKYNHQYQLYFGVLYHGLEVAIEKKFKRLELGRTAKEAKASMGAVPLENVNYYKINNPVLGSLFNKIRKNFARKTGDNWVNRQPLK
jgi:hypothetical protein